MARPAAPGTLALDFDAWPRVDRADLSGFMAELADEAGLEAVRWLIAHWGDTKLSVPKRADGRSLPMCLQDVAENHSRALVRTIVKLRGGEPVHIPAPEPLHDLAIRRDIKRLYNGRNAAELAIRFQRSHRSIVRIGLSKGAEGLAR